jgi:uncharacterized protein (DUF1697 family)
VRQVLMLRGINLGPSRRVPMADLRDLFAQAGYTDVRTYVQSGNVVLGDASRTGAELEREAAALISKRFGFDVPVIARTRDELDAVVSLNPLGDLAADPKRYQVSFLSAELSPEAIGALQDAAAASERVVAHGREIYAWHPAGVARSKLATALAGQRLGVTATARNWTTVTTLLELAGGA